MVARLLPTAVFFVILLLPSFVLAESVALTLDEAIQIALENNPEIKAFEAGLRSADAARKQARGRYGPIINVTSNALFWDDESVMSLGGDDGGAAQLPPPATPYEQTVAGLMAGLSEPTVLQEKFTSETKVTLAMPLTQFYQVHQGYKISKLGKDVAKSQLTGSRQGRILDAVTAYFRVLQAQAQVETASSSLRNLEEQGRIVKSFVQQGMLARVDLLKIEVAMADADRNMIEARSMVRLAQANLATVLGLETGTELSPIAMANNMPEQPKISLEKATQIAFSKRAEILEISGRSKQASRAYKISIADMFPAINLVGAYTHTEGVGMGRDDTLFAGFVLDWNAWEWGATYYGIDKAREERIRSSHLRKHVKRMIRLEVQKALIDYQTAYDTLKVIKASVKAAQETYDIESKNLALGMGTTADVLDAQAALAKASNNYAAVVYNCYIAKAASLKAIGENISSDNLL